jgi:MoxR-like ATPase
MAARKTPILLRRAPLSGGIMALHRYTRKTIWGREVLDAGFDGKQDVTADFDALVCELLLDPAPKIVEQLDGAARGMELTAGEREEISAFRKALIEIVERHNAGPHVRRSPYDPMSEAA